MKQMIFYLNRMYRGLSAIVALCITWPNLSIAEESAAESRAQTFQAVSGAIKEDVPGGPLLIAAYAFVWAALFFYIWRLHKQQTQLQAELNDLKKRMTNQG